MKEITGIILTGGRSSRMGTEKGLIAINGTTFIESTHHILNLLCTHILVSANNPDYDRFGYTIVPDAYTDCGPAAGIAATLSASASDWNLVVAVDLQDLTVTFLQSLTDQIETAEAGGYLAILPVHDQQIEPLVALYHKNALPFIDKALQNGTKALYRIVKEMPVLYSEAGNHLKKHPSLFRNLNDREELESWISSATTR